MNEADVKSTEKSTKKLADEDSDEEDDADASEATEEAEAYGEALEAEAAGRSNSTDQPRPQGHPGCCSFYKKKKKKYPTKVTAWFKCVNAKYFTAKANFARQRPTFECRETKYTRERWPNGIQVCDRVMRYWEYKGAKKTGFGFFR